MPRSTDRLRDCAAIMFALVAVTATPAAAAAPSPIKHVFVVVLENKGYDNTFGPKTKAPYLARTLAAEGQLVPNYYGIGHSSLDNYIAMVSGQAPNPQTQGDCPIFTEFAPGTIGPDGQAIGQGCVYPSTVRTVANQLSEKGLTWKGYMEDMGNSATEPKTCRHPPIGGEDKTEAARPGDQYAGRHNPFIYFHAVIDSPICDQNVVPLDRLPAALGSADTTPNFSFITPNLCSDAHDQPCIDGSPGGLPAADRFLMEWVPRIQASPGYRDGGLIMITFDEAGSDATACCDEQPGFNTPNPGGLNQGPGGGRTGAVVLSPYVQPGVVNQTPYNHYSLLRGIEDVFGLSHLGYAGRAGLVGVAGPAMINRPAGEPPAGGVGAGACRDRTRPTSTVRRGSLRVTRGGVRLRGVARDRGCPSARVQRVEVALARRVGSGCRFVRRDGTFSPRRRCTRPTFLPARGTAAWRFASRPLKPGRYVLRIRAVDGAGNREAAARRRTISVRVR